MRRPHPLSAALLLTLAACSSSSTTSRDPAAGATPRAGDAGATTPPSSPASGDDSGAAVAPPPDAGTVLHDAGVEPHDASPARDCGSNLTAPIAADARALWTPMNPVVLGEGFDANSASIKLRGEQWAQGSSSTTDYPSGQSFAGDQVSASDLAIFGTELPTNGYQNPNQIDVWTAAMGYSATRLTYGWGARQSSLLFSLGGSLAKTPVTPSPPATFVRSFEAERTFEVVFGVELDSACKIAALGDVLGGLAKAEPVLSDVAHRDAISKVLVQNGGRLTFHVIGNMPHPAVDALFAQSHCTTADLGECKRVLDALHAESDAWNAALGTPTLDAVSNKTDPIWSVLTFTTSDVAILP
jgi:hypothetical protein